MSLLANHHDEDRPWGSFERFTLNEPTTVKLLRLNPNMEVSLQKHVHRSEFWKIIEGNGIATLGTEQISVSPGSTIEIPLGTLHRLKAGLSGLLWLEIAFGEFYENDIERVEDDFGRV